MGEREKESIKGFGVRMHKMLHGTSRIQCYNMCFHSECEDKLPFRLGGCIVYYFEMICT